MPAPDPQPQPQPLDWFALLQAACAKRRLRKTAVLLGYSHTSISLVLNGKYPGATTRLAAKVLEILGGVACPHLGQQIPRAVCEQYRARDVPMSNPAAAQHWAACQTCENNPHARPKETTNVTSANPAA